MKPARGSKSTGPTQRQLRAGELVRHALVEILREEEFADEALQRAPVTVTQARISPDLRHAVVFIEPLGGAHAGEAVAALNRHARFIRGRLGHAPSSGLTTRKLVRTRHNGPRYPAGPPSARSAAGRPRQIIRDAPTKRRYNPHSDARFSST